MDCLVKTASLLGILLMFFTSLNANRTNINPQEQAVNRTHDHPEGSESSEESRLVEHLSQIYKTHNPRKTRPVLDSSDNVTVHFGMGLIQILQFKEREQMLNSLIWKQYFWYDQYLTWNPDDYGGVKLARFSPNDIWTPDIVLFNNAGKTNVEEHDKVMLIVNNTGGVTWIPAVQYQSSCMVDMKDYPFDKQLCYFRFGSWTQSSNLVDIRHIYGMKSVDLRNFMQSSEWIIVENYASERRLKDYACCEEPFAEIIYEIHMQRAMTLHIRLILVPTILLSALACAIFWIPPNRPDRTTMGLGLFSAFFLLLISILSNSPAGRESRLGIYYIVLLVLDAIGVFFSVIIVNIFNRNKEVPSRVEGFIRWVDGLSCCGSKKRKRRSSKARKTPSSVEQGVKIAPPSVPLNAARWQRFARILDRMMFFTVVIIVSIAYITIFPRPLFIFGR